MNSVRPLAFLLGRSILNGVKRAVGTPKRLIPLVFTLGYYWLVLLRPFSGAASPRRLPPGAPVFDLPPEATLDAVVFGLVGAMSLLLMTSVLSVKGGFKAADVDVLFPTPVSPKVVLVFRIARDTLATLLIPLFIGLIGYRSAAPALAPLFRNYPRQGGDVLRGFSIAYLLVSFVWVCVGYAASLFVNRSDLQSDRNRKIINGAVFAVVAGVLGYVALRLRADLSVATLLDIAHNPVVRVVLAPVTLATWAVMGGFQGQPLLALAGLLGLCALVALTLRVALTQVGWMYDQAAVRGFESGPNVREFQRKGDMMGLQAERARQGKLKHGRLARWIARFRVRGPMALLWKEAILQARGPLSGFVALGVIFLGFDATAMWITSNGRPGPLAAGWTLMGIQGFLVYFIAMANSQSGFIELLRRVDVQKPLPFTPAATVFWETVAKAVAPSILGFLGALVGVGFAPAAWRFAVAGTLMTPTLAILLSSVVLLVVVLFPDVEDPTQRSFRGMMLLLGMALCLLPGGVLLLGLVLGLHASPIVAALPVDAVSLGIAVGLSTVSGRLYAGYNPSE